ncbi:hypothetical protein ACV3P1_12715 [Clostridium perfringens]|uniref:hypothetical protein n=1 Tax=Clostridium perfringens TaxID=1502 RepID=UPI0039EA66AC
MNESSLFFIDKKRNEYSFDKFPEALYIDTSFWIEVFGGNNSEYSRDCRNFLQDCLKNKVILVTSNRVKGEIEINKKRAWIKEVATKYPNLIVKCDEKKINLKKTFQNIVSNDELYKEFLSLINADMEVIDKMCMMAEYNSDTEFWEYMLNLKKNTKYIIEDKDAEHLAIALKYGVNSIATIDGDYFSTDNLNIFTIPTERNKNEALGRANMFNEFNKDLFEK